ncbi:multi-sensor signal transduction histidine kinase [Candidatus Moduliflexus flocculans]|uniref:histidine kinase n=1 Tax=Candidatus Moduliflexus flocculans TaxID=1499966 RepID=A0A0S6VU76_9BACT|nr:multi-sensor signal transduction histidine kinase [Candidatus Moduliflexus flocculans]
MDESSLFIRKISLKLFGAGVVAIAVTAYFGRQPSLRIFAAFGCMSFLALVHVLLMKSVGQFLENRVHKTQRIVEESYTQELKEYTKKLEDEAIKLQEMTDFLNSILDSSTEYSIITTGKDGKITLFNKGAERLLGYEAADVLNKETPLLFLRSAASRSFAQIAVQIMKYGVDEGEWEVIRKDGDTRTMIFTMTPMKNRDGKMLGFLGIAKDVTEQKKLEKQLQNYTENLEQIVERRTAELDAQRQTAENRALELDKINKLSQSISSTIELEEVLSIGARWVVDLLHVTQARLFLIKEHTEELESLYKYDIMTLQGDLNYVSAPLSRYPDFIRAIQTGKPVIIEDVEQSTMTPEVKKVFEKQGVRSIIYLPLMSKDGAIGIMMLLQIGEVRNFSAEEITLAETVASQLAVALKNAQLFRHVSEEKGRIEALVNSSGDGILMMDKKFQIILSNVVVNRLLQIEAEKFHDKTLVDFVDAQKDNLKEFDTVKEHIYRMMTAPEQQLIHEVTLISPPKVLKIIGNPVRAEEKEVIGHMMVLHDITQEKQLEQMREDFISMIVHDLKNPLAGVIGFSEIMLGKSRKQSLTEFEHHLTNILHQANTMHDMVNNILEVHKMEDGSMEIEKEIADFDDIIVNAIRQVDMSARQKDIEIRTDVPEDFPTIFVDQSKIVRLFANILSNAVKYTPEGGIITIHTKIQQDTILTSISDTGQGIPPEYLDKIFDRFSQVNRKQQGKAASVGLGLYFCKLVIEAHGGKIWAESDYGKGSTFYFTLPHLLAQASDEFGATTL